MLTCAPVILELRYLALAMLLAFSGSCGDAALPETFLQQCDHRFSNDGCSEGTECICEDCTTACNDDSECKWFSDNAVCAPMNGNGACASSSCQQPCTLDRECRALGKAYEFGCSGGFCAKARAR